MSEHTTAPAGSVVVGADGSERGFVGVRWAAREAQRTGAPLYVLCAVPHSPHGPLLVVPESDLQTYGTRVAADSVAMARKVAPEVDVEGVVRPGNRISELVGFSRDSALLVLGARHLSLTEHVWTGATVTGVVSRAACPVLVVPAAWEPVEHDTGDVVVGFKEPEHADVLLRAAFATASDVGAAVRVMHVWRLDGVYDDMVIGRAEEDEWSREELAVIERHLSELRDAYPDVAVRVSVEHDRPAKALVEASASAGRLFIGKPAHGGAFHHLGSTARGILRGSRCPVQVLPVAQDPTRGEGGVEREGQLVR
jgi:nucleotide-binding universal stress UspA family protein